MARPFKKGIDYFQVRVDTFDDDKTEELLMEYGPLGFTVYMKLLCLVYKTDYYFQFGSVEKLAVKIIKSIGAIRAEDKNRIPAIIYYCGKTGLFDAELLKQGVITSADIQRHYFHAVEKRKQKPAAEELPFLLIKAELINASLITVNEELTGVNDGNNSVNDGGNSTEYSNSNINSNTILNLPSEDSARERDSKTPGKIKADTGTIETIEAIEAIETEECISHYVKIIGRKPSACMKKLISENLKNGFEAKLIKHFIELSRDKDSVYGYYKTVAANAEAEGLTTYAAFTGKRKNGGGAPNGGDLSLPPGNSSFDTDEFFLLALKAADRKSYAKPQSK